MEINNRAFTAALLNPASEQYQSMYEEVSHLVRVITRDDDNHFSAIFVPTIEDSEFTSFVFCQDFFLLQPGSEFSLYN